MRNKGAMSTWTNQEKMNLSTKFTDSGLNEEDEAANKFQLSFNFKSEFQDFLKEKRSVSIESKESESIT